MTTHSSILAWKIPWTDESGGLHTAHGVAELAMTDGLSTQTHTHTHTHPEPRTVKTQLLIKENLFNLVQETKFWGQC